MILVDSSIWIDHLRSGNSKLFALLLQGRVLGHPFVIGELALGSISQREVVLGALRNLPAASVATDDEVYRLIERQPLHNLGIGYIDAHLLAAVRLTPGSLLWTRDKRLLDVATRLDMAMA